MRKGKIIMKSNKSKIDELVNLRESLKIKRQKVMDSMHEKNSAIETQIKKLENKTYHYKVEADAEVADIDRQIVKLTKLIKLEKEYVCSFGEDESETKKTRK